MLLYWLVWLLPLLGNGEPEPTKKSGDVESLLADKTSGRLTLDNLTDTTSSLCLNGELDLPEGNETKNHLGLTKNTPESPLCIAMLESRLTYDDMGEINGSFSTWTFKTVATIHQEGLFCADKVPNQCYAFEDESDLAVTICCCNNAYCQVQKASLFNAYYPIELLFNNSKHYLEQYEQESSPLRRKQREGSSSGFYVLAVLLGLGALAACVYGVVHILHRRKLNQKPRKKKKPQEPKSSDPSAIPDAGMVRKREKTESQQKMTQL